jgi:Sulfotransferase domain
MQTQTEPVKTFCIGLNKTGTISLHQALTTLGFSSLHWGGQASRQAVERAIREDKPLLEYLGDYDAYSDIQRLSVNFDVLDRQYPGSRFILTTRDIDGWIDSRRRHVERNRERQSRGEYDGTFLQIEPDRWREQFVGHHTRVEEYFRGRDNLLVMRVTEGDGYEVLCPFLGVQVVASEFPWSHRDPSVSS